MLRAEHQQLWRKTRITNGDSPYTVTATDQIIFANTNGGAITINLLAGIDSKHHKIINSGTSSNDVTVNPNGSEKIYGGTSAVVSDWEVIDIHFDSTDGWG